MIFAIIEQPYCLYKLMLFSQTQVKMSKRLKHNTFICFRSTCAKQLSKNNKRPASLARASSLCTFKTHKCYPIMQHMDCQYLLFQLYHFEHRQQKLKVCSLVHLHCLYLCWHQCDTCRQLLAGVSSPAGRDRLNTVESAHCSVHFHAFTSRSQR